MTEIPSHGTARSMHPASQSFLPCGQRTIHRHTNKLARRTSLLQQRDAMAGGADMKGVNDVCWKLSKARLESKHKSPHAARLSLPWHSGSGVRPLVFRKLELLIPHCPTWLTMQRRRRPLSPPLIASSSIMIVRMAIGLRHSTSAPAIWFLVSSRMFEASDVTCWSQF